MLLFLLWMGCAADEPAGPAVADVEGAARAAPSDAAHAADAAAAAHEAAPAPVDVDGAVARALPWLTRWNEANEPRFDAAIGLHAVAALHPPARPLADAVTARVDADGGNPMRRFFEPDQRLPAGMSTAWTPPAEGRVSPNRLLVEALHCPEHGWRAETTAYACGPMRDRGGYQTAHGVWALDLAVDRGCVDRAETCLDALVAELAAAQPAAPGTAVLDADLYAERLLMTVLAAETGADAALADVPDADAALADGDPSDTDRWARALVAAQQPDGSWGTPGPDDAPYFSFHATMAATWALLAWDAARP